MKIGSLCTGYGGLDMAARAVFGGELAWWSDNEPGPIKVMQHHTDAPNLGDLKLIDWADVEPVDILTAGYPCQPFSNAGKRKGTDDLRHLWPWIAYGIAHLRPGVVVLENVGAHLKRGFRVVAADLAALGYRVGWTLLRASDVGAAHRRERLFIVATDTAREHDHRSWDLRPGRRSQHPDGGGQAGQLTLLPTPTATDANAGRNATSGRSDPDSQHHSGTTLTDVMYQREHGLVDWREYEPAIRRWEAVLDRAAPYPAARGARGGVKVNPAFGEWLMGLPKEHITDVPGLSINEQLKLVGNGVMPQQAEHAVRWILDQLRSEAAMTTDTSTFFGEQQSNDVPRDQWGRYRLPDADGTETGWTRATTFAATLAEQYGLSIWHQRQVVWGLSRRTDLIELAATIAGPEDKKALGSIVDEAHVAAGTEAKANRGTALHKASEIGDRANGNVGAVPPQFQQDYAAYRAELQRVGIVILPEWIERVMITPEYHVAGTPDRLVRCSDGQVRVLDLKTGNLDYAQLEWAVQLALYAHAKAARNYATNSYEQLPEIADDYAIVAHIRPESGVCELYRVDIRMGWAFARLCAEVRDARQHKALLTPLVVEPGNAFRPDAHEAIAALPDATLTVTMDNTNATFTPSNDTASFWSGPEDTDDGLSYNGVPLAKYGQPAAPVERDEMPVDTAPSFTVGAENEWADPANLNPSDDELEQVAQELAKRPKAQLQQIARDLMAQASDAAIAPHPVDAQIKLNQHRIKIAREIVDTATKAGVPIPGVKGTGAHNAAPVPQPGDPAATDGAPGEKVYAADADKVAQAREAQWRATMFDAIRSALTVAKLEVLRSQAGPKWDDEMTESARARVAELDAQSAESASRVLSPLDMIRGATSRETLSKAWEVATNKGANLDGWTAELDAAAKAKMGVL